MVAKLLNYAVNNCSWSRDRAKALCRIPTIVGSTKKFQTGQKFSTLPVFYLYVAAYHFLLITIMDTEDSVKTFLNKNFVEIADVVSDRSLTLATQLEKERDNLSEVIY